MNERAHFLSIEIVANTKIFWRAYATALPTKIRRYRWGVNQNSRSKMLNQSKIPARVAMCHRCHHHTDSKAHIYATHHLPNEPKNQKNIWSAIHADLCTISINGDALMRWYSTVKCNQMKIQTTPSKKKKWKRKKLVFFLNLILSSIFVSALGIIRRPTDDRLQRARALNGDSGATERRKIGLLNTVSFCFSRKCHMPVGLQHSKCRHTYNPPNHWANAKLKHLPLVSF